MFRFFAISCLLAATVSGQTCPYRTNGVIDGDVTLGFMFPFMSGDLCDGAPKDLSTIQLVEAAIYAVKEANQQNTIPGVRIGLEVWDSCYSTNVVTDRGIAFLRDRKVSYEQNAGDNCGTQFKPAMVGDLRGERGPTAASLFSDAQLPVISYAATLPSLTVSPRFDYFSRVIPSDAAEARAVAILLLSQGWKYVSLVHDDSVENLAAAEAFRAEAAKSKICISQTFSIGTGANDATVISAAASLSQQTRTRFVVTFLSSVEFFVQLSIQPDASNFEVIAGHRSIGGLLSGVSLPLDVVIASPLGVNPTTPHTFDDFFKGLSLSSADDQADPWFTFFWESAYSCTARSSCGSAQEALHRQNYQRNLFALSVIDSVRATIRALGELHLEKCGGVPTACDAFMASTPGEVQDAIRSVAVTGDRSVAFDASGNPAKETFVYLRVDTQSGALNELARSVDGTFMVTGGSTDLLAEPVSCGDPCMDLACLPLDSDNENVTQSHIDGEILLAGMFAINEFDPETDGGCGALSPEGVLRLEAMLYAVDQINRDPEILPTVTLGVEGINTCGDSQRAGHGALKLVSQYSFGRSASGLRETGDSTKQHLYGIVGPPSSEETRAVASVVQTYGLPLVGYEADSHQLSSPSTVPNFARVVPTYIQSFFAVGEVLQRWNLLYVQVLLSEENYSLNSIMRSYFQRNEVCVAQNLQVPADDSGWDQVFSDLSSKPEARAIVIAASPPEIQQFLAQIQQRNLIGQYFLIASDDWPLENDFVAGYESAARGTLVVKTSPRQYGEFQSYVATLNPASNLRNPWFRQYWMDRFSCNLPGETSQYSNPCTGNEALQPNTDVNDDTAAYVIDAVYALAQALHEIHTSVCGPTFRGVCGAMDDLPGDDVFSELIQMTLTSPNSDRLPISIGYNGDSNVPYHIFNIQPGRPVEVATFDQFTLTDMLEPQFYAADGSVRTSDLYSVCNKTKCLECDQNGKDSVAYTTSGDIWIGGFFEVSEPDSTQIECTDRLVLYNMQLLEAFLFAIDEVNNDASLLPGLTLGGIGFDSCGSKKRVGKEVGNFYSGTVDYRPGYNPNRVSIAGMVGGGSSDTTQALSNTLVNLNINTISYGATASTFSDSKKFPHVLRTVPSDEKQAEALASVLADFGWKYVSIVYSDNVYGNDISQLFTEAAVDFDICIAMSLVVGKSTSQQQYGALIDTLRANTQSRVVVLLTSDLDTRSVLQAAEKRSVDDIQWVGGDTWGSRGHVIQEAEMTSVRAVTLQFRKSTSEGFREYFTNLRAYTNFRNPWWANFWSDTFGCNLLIGRDTYNNSCSFSLDLADWFVQAPEVTYVINAVRALAVGLDAAMAELCPGVTNHICPELQNDQARLADIIRETTFTGADGDIFSFDAKGDGPAVYDILYIKPGSDTVYTKIGSWDKGTLSLDEQPDLSAYGCIGRCDECQRGPSRQVASIPGELQIPALVGVHGATAGVAHSCGDLREAGIVNVEAVLYAVAAINVDDSLLKGVQLGTTIFDSCLSPGPAVGQLSSYLSRTGDYEGDTTWRYIAGIVGAEDRDVTKYTSDIAEQYQFIQVAYSSVDSSANPFLLQTSPSLHDHFGVIQDILDQFGWNFVLLVSEGRDSQHKQLAESIFDAQSDLGFCVERFFEYDRPNTDTENTLQLSEANVVILVMSVDSASQLTNRLNLERHVTFIVINTYPGPTSGAKLSQNLAGAIVVSIDSPSVSFTNHLASLQFDNNARNPWFDEFVMSKYGCTPSGSQKCGTDLGLTDPAVSVNVNNVIDAVYGIARGIDWFRTRLCGAASSGLCLQFFDVTTEEIGATMMDSDYLTDDGSTVNMINGTARRSFTLWNSDRTGSFSMVGSWNDEGLIIGSVYLEDTTSTEGRVKSSRDFCTPKKGAIERLVLQSQIDQLWFIIVLILAVIGIILSVAFLVCVFLRRDAPQAQVYSMFLTTFLLTAIVIIFLQNFLLVVEPSAAVCIARQVVFTTSIAASFVAVFLMTIRIYRILAREKRIAGPRTLYVNNKSQMRLFGMLMSIQVIVVLQALFYEPSEVVADDGNVGRCGYENANFPVSMLYTYLLMVASLVVSILALRRSKTILSKEVWLGLFSLIVCIILVAVWIVVGIIELRLEFFDASFLPASSFLSVALGYFLLLFFIPIRVYNLWRDHDPFNDSASVISGELRDPQSPMDDNIYNIAEDNAVGGHDNHTYDDPTLQKKLSESMM